jgi:hypothetical protein
MVAKEAAAACPASCTRMNAQIKRRATRRLSMSSPAAHRRWAPPRPPSRASTRETLENLDLI